MGRGSLIGAGLAASSPISPGRRRPTLIELHQVGKHTIAELEGLFGVIRSTVYRAIQRAGKITTSPAGIRLNAHVFVDRPRARLAPRCGHRRRKEAGSGPNARAHAARPASAAHEAGAQPPQTRGRRRSAAREYEPPPSIRAGRQHAASSARASHPRTLVANPATHAVAVLVLALGDSAPLGGSTFHEINRDVGCRDTLQHSTEETIEQLLIIFDDLLVPGKRSACEAGLTRRYSAVVALPLMTVPPEKSNALVGCGRISTSSLAQSSSARDRLASDIVLRPLQTYPMTARAPGGRRAVILRGKDGSCDLRQTNPIARKVIAKGMMSAL